MLRYIAHSSAHFFDAVLHSVRAPLFLASKGLCQWRTNEAERIDVIAELIEDHTRHHQASHEHGRQETQLSIAQVEIGLQFHPATVTIQHVTFIDAQLALQP